MLDDICMWLVHPFSLFNFRNLLFQRASLQLCVSEYLWPANKQNLPFPHSLLLLSWPTFPLSLYLLLSLCLSPLCVQSSVVMLFTVILHWPATLIPMHCSNQLPTPYTCIPIPDTLIPTPVITVLWGSAVVETWSPCASRAAFTKPQNSCHSRTSLKK